jgi:hypothetical protein
LFDSSIPTVLILFFAEVHDWVAAHEQDNSRLVRIVVALTVVAPAVVVVVMTALHLSTKRRIRGGGREKFPHTTKRTRHPRVELVTLMMIDDSDDIAVDDFHVVLDVLVVMMIMTMIERNAHLVAGECRRRRHPSKTSIAVKSLGVGTIPNRYIAVARHCLSI